jgi:hypothetical protein
LTELEQTGRLAVVVGRRDQGLEVISRLAGLATAKIVSVSEVALHDPPARNEEGVLARIGGERFLIDLECLCWQPHWRLDPLKLCRLVARPNGLVALWPGDLAGRTMMFSSPGRSDAISVLANDLLVLHPLATRFPDEPPFSIERIAT